MADTLKSLLLEQQESFRAILRALINFKKTPKVNITEHKSRGRLAALDRLWDESRSLHIKIVQLASAEEQKTLSYFTEEEYLTAEEAYHEAADFMHETIGKLCKPEPLSLEGSGESSYREPLATSSIQLPRISLPKFTGQYTEWESFRGIFESLIAANETLSSTQKLHYLKASVSGSAASLIGNLQISDANYAAAWQLLIDEYDNKYAIVQAHVRAFADLPALRNENARDLKSFRDTVAASLAALTGLGRPVRHWDDLLVFIVVQRLPPKTRNDWNLQRGASRETPTYKELHDFISSRVRGLADCAPAHEGPPSVRGPRSRAIVHNLTVLKCIYCSGNHVLYKCKDFTDKSIEQRHAIARQKNLCLNCLKCGHGVGGCPSRRQCVRCGRRHHTLLHPEPHVRARADETTPTTARNFAPVRFESHGSPAVRDDAPVATVQTVHSPPPPAGNVLLATAWVNLHTTEGRSIQVRALLDQGSTFSFVSESLCQSLRVGRQRANLRIRCFGEQYSGSARSRISVTISSCSGDGPSLPLVAYVYQRITAYAAKTGRTVASWPHLRGLSLADPDPSSNCPIHLLIGADLYGALLMNDLRQGPLGTPTAQLTIFGWVVFGPADSSTPPSDIADVNCVCDEELAPLLQRFWEVEEIPSSSPALTEEDDICEKQFIASHQRTSEGRYVVRLPFKGGLSPSLGSSLAIASNLYSKLERRLSRKPDLAAQYHHFLSEYESLGHMEKLSVPDRENAFNSVYIPHHAVEKASSSTTKLRVVFNASCRTANGLSLNEHLLKGPKLQQDLCAVVLRWRQFRHVYTADVAKMYRQILVHRDDVDFQRIVWRPPHSDELSHYRLLTVTYGMAPAPYLAMRVLRQLASDEAHAFPDAVPIFNHGIYVDDALFGANDIPTLINLRNQLIAMMSRGGFQLRKWAASSPELLDDIPPDHRELTHCPIAEDETLKVLGLSWLPHDDMFRFVFTPCNPVPHSKRTILAFIAKLFDPLGWASPVTINAKIFLQELWLLKTGWDDSLPPSLVTRWADYCTNLPYLNRIRVPRWIGTRPEVLGLEIHGFADASKCAYAAVAYLRIMYSLTDFRVCLLAAKTKVAPLKTISVPRLELSAVVLLSRLLRWIRTSLNLIDIPFYGWTDSTVTLAWLKQHPSKWKVFVANRVSEVQTTMPSVRWAHVPSKDNPADCASRGLTAEELLAHTLWWSGPSWLAKHSTSWPSSVLPETTDLASTLSEQAVATSHHVETDSEWDLPERYSTWSKLMRVTAYIMRFISNVRNRRKSLPTCMSHLGASEIHDAEVFWLRLVQRGCFPSELAALQHNATLPKSSSLRTLSPILGAQSLIRLGGRLANAPLTYNERHPVILPEHRLTHLLIDRSHKRTLHGGTQATLQNLRQQYWILSARKLIKGHIRRCLPCVRHRAKSAAQKMGDLPSSRVRPSSPFTHTGIDYAGPLNLTMQASRGYKSSKHYVAVFVCFSTKAIHLECVEDYSTAGFLAAFHRFVSRRGLPSHVYSDHGTNFQGADRELQRAFRATTQDPQLHQAMANDHVTWHFSPPAAPHFGGLWEAGVKSFKLHLKRVSGAHILSRSEFVTLLCRIEACLNSRPLAALTDDPTDMAALTPGHFLIGRPLVSVPEESVTDVNPSRLDRWQLVRQMQERIWRCWSADYLHSLQQRYKWSDPASNVQINELVLLKTNLLPPAKWELGRIHQVHPGSDGLTRVVTVRTARGLLRRPIVQICQLPIPVGSLSSEPLTSRLMTSSESSTSK